METFAEKYGSVTIQTLGKGEVLGWSCLIPPYHWRFDARATEPTDVIVLNALSLRARCERNHSFGYDLFRRLSSIAVQRLELTKLQLVTTYGASHH